MGIQEIPVKSKPLIQTRSYGRGSETNSIFVCLNSAGVRERIQTLPLLFFARSERRRHASLLVRHRLLCHGLGS